MNFRSLVVKVLRRLEEFLCKLRYRLQAENVISQYEKLLTEKQRRCSHLKGGKRVRGPARDYCVQTHTFINGATKIWCGLCGVFAWSDGPVAAWLYMQSLADYSTNTSSSSEIPFRDGPSITVLQPIHGQDKYLDHQIRLGIDDNPIRGDVVKSPKKGDVE